jgi:transcriptional regulator with XRE-family HTH domain
MSDFQKYLEQQMNDPEFAAEWESLEPEYQIMRAIVEARRKSHLTQKQLSLVTGINQADISKLETGNCNPSLRTLNRLAEGMGMILRVEFVPMKEKKA